MCRLLCQIDLDCLVVDAVHECANGICTVNPTPDCTAATACTNPPQCHVLDNVVCAGGRCVYALSHVDDCCESDTDCASHNRLECSVQSQCSGTRIVSACSTADNTCYEDSSRDDSACAGLLGSDCGRYRDYYCGDAIDQAPPACATNCRNPSSTGPDDTKCDPGMQCVYVLGDFTCQIPGGVGQCCNDPTNCPLAVSCADGVHCGNTQSPPVYVCCQAGTTCCARHDDPACASQGYDCNTDLFQCYTACTGIDNSHCATGYVCDPTGNVQIPEWHRLRRQHRLRRGTLC